MFAAIYSMRGGIIFFWKDKCAAQTLTDMRDGLGLLVNNRTPNWRRGCSS